MEKLMPLIDFVLEQNEIAISKIIKAETKDSISDCIDADFNFRNIVSNYAKFIKQPLTLGIFVPVYEGNVLIEPAFYKDWLNNENNFRPDEIQIFNIYKEAKEKVLFEGFEYVKKTGSYSHHLIKDGSNIEINVLGPTIEDYIFYEFKLTESALKQISL